MGENRSLLTALGAILGLVLFIFIIIQGVNYFREGAAEFEEMQRQAGAPILLSETLQDGNAITDTAELTDTVAMTEATAMTDTAALTDTASLTDTAAMTATAAATDTVAMTDTVAVADSAAMTETEAITEAAVSTETVAAADTDVLTDTAVATDTVAATETAETEAAETEAEVPAEEAVVEATPTEEAAPVAEAEEPTAEPTVEPTVEATPTEEAVAVEAVAGGVPSPDDVTPIVTKAGCIGCHVIPGIPSAVGMVGPDLTDIGVNAATRIDGYTAEEYLYESLLQPNAFIAPECPTGPCLPGLMVQNLGDVLTEEELDTVVSYLASLGTGQ